MTDLLQGEEKDLFWWDWLWNAQLRGELRYFCVERLELLGYFGQWFLVRQQVV